MVGFVGEPMSLMLGTSAWGVVVEAEGAAWGEPKRGVASVAGCGGVGGGSHFA